MLNGINESFIEVERVLTFNNDVIVNTVTLPFDDLFDLIYKINCERARYAGHALPKKQLVCCYVFKRSLNGFDWS